MQRQCLLPINFGRISFEIFSNGTFCSIHVVAHNYHLFSIAILAHFSDLENFVKNCSVILSQSSEPEHVILISSNDQEE